MMRWADMRGKRRCGSDEGNMDNRTFHPGKTLDQHPTAVITEGGLQMNRAGPVSPVGRSFCCGLFVCFHCVPETRGNISEGFFPGIIKHLFPATLPQRRHQKGEQTPGMKRMSVLVLYSRFGWIPAGLTVGSVVPLDQQGLLCVAAAPSSFIAAVSSPYSRWEERGRPPS